MSVPESPSDPSIRLARLERGPFAYTEEGAGPTALAIHGLPGSVRDFRWLASALDGRVRFVRLDQPGFGATPVRTGTGARLPDRVRFVRDAIDALGLDRVTLLAHSMGGPLAMAVAAEEPRVERLALLAPRALHHLLAGLLPPGIVPGEVRAEPQELLLEAREQRGVAAERAPPVSTSACDRAR